MNIAFLSALGRSDTESVILGAASGAADILKAVLPLFILWAWRAGRSRFVLPATAVWVVFAGFSLLSAFGFTAGNRIEAAAQQTALNDRLDRVQSEAAAARARIAALPASRPVAVIDAEIARLRQNVRWQSTRACTDATVPASRTYCAQYFARVGERASARAADELKAQLDQFARREEDLISQGAGRIADPQSSLLAGIFQVPENRVRLILITVLALVIELGSGLGFTSPPAIPRGVADRREATASATLRTHPRALPKRCGRPRGTCEAPDRSKTIVWGGCFPARSRSAFNRCLPTIGNGVTRRTTLMKRGRVSKPHSGKSPAP